MKHTPTHKTLLRLLCVFLLVNECCPHIFNLVEEESMLRNSMTFCPCGIARVARVDLVSIEFVFGHLADTNVIQVF